MLVLEIRKILPWSCLLDLSWLSIWSNMMWQSLCGWVSVWSNKALAAISNGISDLLAVSKYRLSTTMATSWRLCCRKRGYQKLLMNSLSRWMLWGIFYEIFSIWGSPLLWSAIVDEEIICHGTIILYLGMIWYYFISGWENQTSDRRDHEKDGHQDRRGRGSMH